MDEFTYAKKQEFIALAKSKNRPDLLPLAAFCYSTGSLTPYEIQWHGRAQGVSDIIFQSRVTFNVSTREQLMEYAARNCMPDLLLFAMNMSPMYITPHIHRTIIYAAVSSGHHSIINLLNRPQYAYLNLTVELTMYAINVACKYNRLNVLRVLDLRYTDALSVIEHINANNNITLLIFLLNRDVKIPHSKISKTLTADLLNYGYKVKGQVARDIRNLRDKKRSLAHHTINNVSIQHYDINITGIITSYISHDYI